jgi:hypothetical protein
MWAATHHTLTGLPMSLSGKPDSSILTLVEPNFLTTDIPDHFRVSIFLKDLFPQLSEHGVFVKESCIFH